MPGGGPGGSTLAALLAERGWNVVIAEKERLPRFHIGESLLPMNMLLLQKLGLYEEVKRIGMPMLPGYTAPKILWLKQNEPANFRRLTNILLPHDYSNL